MDTQSLNFSEDPWTDKIPKSPWYNFCFGENHIKFSVTLLCWGLGFDVGYIDKPMVSFWIGPIYLELNF